MYEVGTYIILAATHSLLTFYTQMEVQELVRPRTLREQTTERHIKGLGKACKEGESKRHAIDVMRDR